MLVGSTAKLSLRSPPDAGGRRWRRRRSWSWCLLFVSDNMGDRWRGVCGDFAKSFLPLVFPPNLSSPYLSSRHFASPSFFPPIRHILSPYLSSRHYFRPLYLSSRHFFASRPSTSTLEIALYHRAAPSNQDDVRCLAGW